MSNFRVILEPDAEFSDRELDWIDNLHHWRLSDKEYGSVTWFDDRDPQEDDLEALRQFFEIERSADLTDLTKLSPGDLARLHAAQTDGRSRVVAQRCPDCESDWLVFKLKDQAWLKYGRRCVDGGWWLGSPADDDEVS